MAFSYSCSSISSFQTPKMSFRCNPFAGNSYGGRLNSRFRYCYRPVLACTKKLDQYLLPGGPKFDLLLDSIKWDDKGLAVAIAQNVDTGAVLMQGFANKDALLTTVSSRKATSYSRSRSILWTKGETSLNFINICDIFLDCDRDSDLLFR